MRMSFKRLAVVVSTFVVGTAVQAAPGTWAYSVEKDAFSRTDQPDTNLGGSANYRFAKAYQNIWIGDWSAAQKADISAKIAGMSAGETYTLKFRIALDDVTQGGDSDVTLPAATVFAPTVGAFRADMGWVEAQVTANSASTGVAWTSGGITKRFDALPFTQNTNNVVGFSQGLLTTYDAGVWAEVVLDSTVTNALLTDPTVRGLRGVDQQALWVNDGVFTKDKWGGRFAPQLELTITSVPEPALVGVLAVGSLTLLRKRRRTA